MTAHPPSPPVALVTGAGQGIGRAIAAHLVAEGWRVHANVRDGAKARRLADAEPAMRVHGGDLGDGDTARGLVGAVLDAEGRLDGVVHAVGPYLTAPLVDTGHGDLRAMFEGNVMTAVAVVDAAREALRDAQGAYVFFGVAGLERWRARTVTGAYVASKAALLAYVRALALEEAPHGVRANMISPGFVPHEGAAADTLSDEMHQRIPQGRAARMDEVTGVASFLLSPDAGHVVGQNIEVAGGWML